jgi:transposase
MTALFEKALGLTDPWYVEKVTFHLESKRLDIAINFRRGSRFSAEEGGDPCPVHDTEERTWRHLNFFQYDTYLTVRVPRVRTSAGGLRLILPPFAGVMHGFTLLFEAFLVELAQHMPVLAIAQMVGVSCNKLWRLLDLYVDGARDKEDYSDLKDVGVDETSVAKGHDYISLFVDMEQRRTLHVAEGKGSQAVHDFAEYLGSHNGDPTAIERVSCDMSPAFIKGVKEALPKAEITFDKFHVVKIINEGVDAVRREEAKSNPLLKKSRYVFLKNDENLTKKQRDKKEELQLCELNLKSMEALRMRETFQQIYQAETQEVFDDSLQKWLDWVGSCELKPMREAAATVEKHRFGITNWFASKLNNGLLEGLNSVIQAAKRKARGYGKKHFATIALLLTGKLNFTHVNPHIKMRCP